MSEKSPAQKAAEALEKERERQRIAQINAQINSNNESIVNYNNWKDSCVSIKSEMTNAVNAWKTAKEEFGKCSIASTVEKKNVFEGMAAPSGKQKNESKIKEIDGIMGKAEKVIGQLEELKGTLEGKVSVLEESNKGLERQK